MLRLVLLALAACPPAWTAAPWEPKALGVLLLGHGGASEWNRAVIEIRNTLRSKYPVEAAFGMADPKALQKGFDALAAARVRKVIVVPLFISSHSEVIDQTQYVLGMRKDPSKDFLQAPHAHMAKAVVRRVQTRLPLVMTPALDDHPLVGEILLARARELSKEPAKEAVVLVGHGPVQDADDGLWLRAMGRLAETVRERGGFASAHAATLRDDSAPEVKAKAEQALRGLVRGLSRRGRVLVVPHLIARGGIERHVRKALDGMFYEWSGKTLLPDPRIAQWAEAGVEQAAALPDMRRFNP